jgi:autotransporter translocation and assembly factor TamB
MKNFVGQNIRQLGFGVVVILLTLQIVMPYTKTSEASANTAAIASLLEAANQYQVPVSKIEQLNHQQCENDKMALAAHAGQVAALADLAKNLALLNSTFESLHRRFDRLERNAGP